MPSKLENALPLSISVRKWVGSVFTSGPAFNFTRVKVKKVGMPHRVTLHLKKISSLKNAIVKLALL